MRDLGVGKALRSVPSRTDTAAPYGLPDMIINHEEKNRVCRGHVHKDREEVLFGRH